MRFIFGLIGLLLAASALGVACDSDETAPNVSPDPPTVTSTTQVVPTAQSQPTPTPPPAQTALPQTVLFDLTSGRSLPLAPPGERSGSIAFSPDGRWLVYYARLGTRESPSYNIYRIDLTSTGLEAELFYEGGSFGRLVYPSVFSSRGDLAFFDRDDDGESWPAVMRPNGSVHRLSNRGHVTSWSPDGRWLTYEEPYREDADGNEIPIAQYLVDTETWEERKIGESGACHCDGNPRPVWAPDSSKFIYTYLV
jgi:Tol biopolymer transport system component